MLFFGKRKSAPLVQSSTEDWWKQWQDLVPPECRNVPVTVDGKTMTAYVQINHFVMMLQDGLLMQQGFLTSAHTFSARVTMSSGWCAARRTLRAAI